MTWSRSGFSKHYKKVIIEGNDPGRLVNICLFKNISVRKVCVISDTEMSLEVSSSEFNEFENAAGGRYRIYVVEEGGYVHRLNCFGRKKSLIAGLILFTCILIYQSLFIAEIEISGYEAINEPTLRESMREAGFYEGCRKNVSLDKVKLHMYEEFDNIAWIGIKYKGNLAQVTIAEVDYPYKKHKVKKTVPCNIIADKSGYISSVDPEQGLSSVENGDYVKEGDVLISGVIPLQKTTYEEESEKETESYVHASGTVDAKIPVRLNFYDTAYRDNKERTGRKMITFSLNGIDTARTLCPYEISSVKRIKIINWVKPLRVKLQVNVIEEVSIKRRKTTENITKKQVINEIHEYVREKLPDNTQILNKSLNFTQEKNIICIGVTLETLQQIGKEEEIIVDKSNRKSDQNDDQ